MRNRAWRRKKNFSKGRRKKRIAIAVCRNWWYEHDGRKYVVDATIHTEISTSNIAEVQESFAVDCATEFAEAIRKIVINNEMLVNVMKKAGKECML